MHFKMPPVLDAILLFSLYLCEIISKTESILSTDPKYLKEIDQALLLTKLKGGPYVDRFDFNYKDDDILYRLKENKKVDVDIVSATFISNLKFNNNFTYFSHFGANRFRFDLTINEVLRKTDYTIVIRLKNMITSNSYIQILVEHASTNDNAVLSIRKFTQVNSTAMGFVRELIMPIPWPVSDLPDFLWVYWTRPQKNFTSFVVFGRGDVIERRSGRESHTPFAVYTNTDDTTINTCGIVLRHYSDLNFEFFVRVHVEWLNLTDELFPKDLNDVFAGVHYWPAIRRSIFPPVI